MQVLQVRIIFQEKGPSTPCPGVIGVFSTPCPRVTGVLRKKKMEWGECLMYGRQYDDCSSCLDLDSGQDMQKILQAVGLLQTTDFILGLT